MWWSAVVEKQSLTRMRKHMFFPMTDPGSKQQERDVAVRLSASYLILLFKTGFFLGLKNKEAMFLH